jgi:hypothetical protein
MARREIGCSKPTAALPLHMVGGVPGRPASQQPAERRPGVYSTGRSPKFLGLVAGGRRCPARAHRLACFATAATPPSAIWRAPAVHPRGHGERVSSGSSWSQRQISRPHFVFCHSHTSFLRPDGDGRGSTELPGADSGIAFAFERAESRGGAWGTLAVITQSSRLWSRGMRRWPIAGGNSGPAMGPTGHHRAEPSMNCPDLPRRRPTRNRLLPRMKRRCYPKISSYGKSCYVSNSRASR